MSDSMRPRRWQPTRLLCGVVEERRDSTGKNTGVGCHFLIQYMHAKSLQLCPTLCHLMESSPPGFSRQEYWSGLPFPSPHGLYSPWTSRPEYWSGWPFPSPGDLPNPGFEPRPPALQEDSLPAELSGKPQTIMYQNLGDADKQCLEGNL